MLIIHALSKYKKFDSQLQAESFVEELRKYHEVLGVRATQDGDGYYILYYVYNDGSLSFTEAIEEGWRPVTLTQNQIDEMSF